MENLLMSLAYKNGRNFDFTKRDTSNNFDWERLKRNNGKNCYCNFNI